MCLAVPARIVELEETRGLVDLHGNRIAISTCLTPEVVVGDWVLVHAGFSIQRLDPEAARATFAALADLAAVGDAEEKKE
ncbi:MAG: HypC/HybG/HupF family hydrogenase formation chaperone [Phycisphaerae bacterium]